MRLTLACVATDRTRPLIDGRVAVEGADLAFEPGEPETIFRRALREGAFAVTELSMSSHILTTTRGGAAYTAIPIWPSRAFRHGAIFVRTDRGITRPEDLAGRTIGVPEYQMTAALWVRAILRSAHGVDTRTIRWRTGGLVQPGIDERLALSLPPGHDLAPIANGETLDALLASGGIDAYVGPRPPPCIEKGAPVARLFADVRGAESAWFRATGFFPIMHCIAIRKDVAEANPGLPRALVRAFSEAKRLAEAELAQVNVLRVALPWAAEHWAETRALMGPDPWAYGFARNRAELATMIEAARDDGLIGRALAPEELFHPDTLDL
ncbi:ABC transporter substrate-binding protein [Elioraea rosea]|uniref:ABC transporter substrate-binding protein n=1 Tax=Elioraea rosea TaxID=2492390 RepID=UPI0011844B25|nr:ABC transporter substrate-binding protein [Elioraea rosea]